MHTFARLLRVGALVGIGLIGNGVQAATSDYCSAKHCNLAADGAYTQLVIGRVAHLGTTEDLQQVYHWAQSHGYWKSLPKDEAAYLRDVKLIAIAVPSRSGDRTITVFMQQDEFVAAPFAVGDLVRYSPHSASHEVPKGNGDDLALYHGLTGCVATLCRQGEAACFKRYRLGVFTKAEGLPIDPETGAIEKNGVRINPLSLLPIQK